MNTDENKSSAGLRPRAYWRLWLADTVLVTAGLLFFLATHYGTYEFFGTAVVMALLPLIPLLVLVGGAGSTVFALTKVQVEKRGMKKPAAVVLLVGPGLLLTLALVLLGASKSPRDRMDYICFGNVPASASQVRVTGYSTFLRKEWLAVFKVGPNDFQTMVAAAELVPADTFEFRNRLEHSALKQTRLYQSLPPLNDALCYKRVFNESQEHEGGSIYAVFDRATSTAVVLREYQE